MSVTTLPSNWFREPAFFALERRAVFSKTWLLVSHKAQFAASGHYASYEVAGYPFFVISDRRGNINAFLNVCRHRAFPIVHEATGKASILSCKYHGWSYGLGGNLAKAPRFDQVSEEDFNKNDYSLYKLHIHIDQLGFIWVNLDAAETPSVSWEEQFKDIDTEQRISRFNPDNYVYDHTWTLDECKFNWKTLIENYNECYHCSTAHPGLAPHFDNNSQFNIETKLCYINHLNDEVEGGGMPPTPTYLFPSSSLTMTTEFFYMMLVEPVSATSSRLRYEFYRHKDSSQQVYKESVDFFKQIEKEDKWLSNNAQIGLTSDTYVAGPLHPSIEKAVMYFEKVLKKMLKNHHEKEKQQAKEIWPATREVANKATNDDVAFCRGICESAAAVGNTDSMLAW